MANTQSMYTIGQLAKRAGVRTSALRYYEEQGLLQPAKRQANGYRLYDETAEQTLRFIQRAQRLGFSLADIQTLLNGMHNGELSEADIVHATESRYMAIEEEVTSLLTLRHEMGLFLEDIHTRVAKRQAFSASSLFEQLLNHICMSPHAQSPATMLEWLLRQTGCQLTTDKGTELLERLRGQHVHIWQEGDAYHILVASNHPEIGEALKELAQLEAQCQLHIHTREAPELMHDDRGYLLICRGQNAFIFARLFLALCD